MTPTEERLAAADAALVRIQQMGNPGSFEPEISFGVLPFDLAGYWDEAVARLQALLDQLSHFASAESAMDSQALARSRIGWTGDLATVWTGEATPAQRQAHFELLEANILYKTRILMVVTASVRAAAAICAVASPLMLPSALRSVTNLVSVLQNLPQHRDQG